HEVTHVVLVGKLGDTSDNPMPRWADEGMAVLSEPRERIDRHLRNLPRHRQERTLFSVRNLMLLSDYPEPRLIGPFYAESVSLVEYLSGLKGPQAFAGFLRDGAKNGYEAALKRCYNIADFNDLETRWRKHAFGDNVTAPGYAERGH